MDKPDPNKELAKRIAKEYGGNEKEILEWLNNHEFEYVVGGGVKLKGLNLEAKYTNPPGTNVKNLTTEILNQVPQTLAEEAGTWLLERIFKGSPVGQILSGGDLANTPSSSDIATRQLRIDGAKNALIRYIFMPQGQQTPSMSNGFKAYSGYSRYDLFYKAK